MLALLVLLFQSFFLNSHGASTDFLLLSETNQLRGISLTNGSTDVITAIGGLSLAVAVDFLAETEQLVWSDVIDDTISVINKTGTNQRVLLRGLSSPEGLAVDWIGQNIFFTDTGLDVIGVVGVDGSFPRTLINSALDEPRAIAVDPEAGYMYWTDWGAVAKIERAYMSGRGRSAIISGNLRSPSGLCLDIAGKRIYWIDASYDKIESSNFDGSGRKVFSYILGSHPFGITLDGSNLFWTDRYKKVVYKMPKTGGGLFSFATFTGTLFGVTLYRNALKGGANGCSGGGKCDQLCLPEPSMSFACSCNYGELQNDNRTCKSLDNYLLVGDIDSVRGLAIDSLDNAVKSRTGLTRAIAVDYDPLTDDIFYTDVSLRSIERISSKSGARTTIVSHLSIPDGIAVDWISRSLFYTDSGLDRIGMARLDGSGHLVVIASGLDQPRGIALALEEGWMFWTDWGTIPKIEKAWMDGTNRKTIVTGNLGWPNGVTLDTRTQTLYWVDAKLDRVEKCDYNGNGRTLLSQPSDPIHPYDLALDNSYLYWTDWIAKNVVRMPVNGGSNHSVYAVPFPRLKQPSGLVLHNATARRLEQNSCSISNGNCLQFCVAVPGGRRCACSASNSNACKPVIVSGPTSTTVYQRNAVTLNCAIGGVVTTGIAISSFGWKKNGITVRTQYGSSSADIRTSWTIPTATKSDGGLYSCWAANKYGTRTSSSALLIVADSPTTVNPTTPTTANPTTPTTANPTTSTTANPTTPTTANPTTSTTANPTTPTTANPTTPTSANPTTPTSANPTTPTTANPTTPTTANPTTPTTANPTTPTTANPTTPTTANPTTPTTANPTTPTTANPTTSSTAIPTTLKATTPAVTTFTSSTQSPNTASTLIVKSMMATSTRRAWKTTEAVFYSNTPSVHDDQIRDQITEPAENQQPTIVTEKRRPEVPTEKRGEFRGNDDTESGGTNTWLYVGFSIMGVIVLACIVLVAILFARKQRRSAGNISGAPSSPATHAVTFRNEAFRSPSPSGDYHQKTEDIVYATIDENIYKKPPLNKVPGSHYAVPNLTRAAATAAATTSSTSLYVPMK